MEQITQINGHRYYRLADVAREAGFTNMGKDDADRSGLELLTMRVAGRERLYVEADVAKRFVERVHAQRADGRQRGFGFTAPDPGKSSAAMGITARVEYNAKLREAGKATDVDPRIDVQATRKAQAIDAEPQPEPSNALAVAQLAAMQAKVESLHARSVHLELMLSAICRELNIKV